MIATLKGIVSLIDSPYIIVDVSGVGYRVLVSAPVLSIVIIDRETKLFTYTHVREEILELYGFLTSDDLKLFERLIGVSGIGPKTAMGIFALGTSSEIIKAILAGDTGYFDGVPRLGKKNAQKIIIELQGKISKDAETLDISKDGVKTSEITNALVSFGFSQKEARGALKNIAGKGETTEEKIRLALKYLGK